MHTLFIYFILIFIQSFQVVEINHLSAEAFCYCMDTCAEKVILDARPNGFNGKYKIPNAVIVSNPNQCQSVLDTIDVDMPLFIYCVEGVRSKKASEIATGKGFVHVFNLKKGIIDYKRKGYAIVRID